MIDFLLCIPFLFIAAIIGAVLIELMTRGPP
jgi:hypothetical protein